MKCILVSQRVDDYPDRGERRDAVDQALVRFVYAAGYLPVPVPNVLADVPAAGPDIPAVSAVADLRRFPGIGGLIGFMERVQPAGVVLSGGNDIGSSADRDFTEAVLLRHAALEGLPVLGICRGMQMMGVYTGSVLENVTGHVRTRHRLQGEWEHEVNSYHSQALGSCPPGFRPLAFSGDGNLEAMQHEHLPWQGWMWHPEREPQFNEADIRHVKSLFG